MSITGDGYLGRHTHRDHNRRAVAEIQKSIIKRGRRNAISRHFHAKNDKEMIAGWRLDLNRILHVFNVRSAASVRRLLNVRSQTELAITTNVVVSDIHHEVVNTQTVVSDVYRGVLNAETIVSDVHHDVATTQTIVSDVHQGMVDTRVMVSELQQGVADIQRTMVKGQEGPDGRNRSVSVAHASFIAESTLTIP